ncbi:MULTISPECIES: hypothetical protein [unclassified Mesorhizobium]|uniref:hypothetical protein n=1 Tax=unclassified Mesorhizobium TaxID=325217 RepID=UPI001126B453|nr:MULTISPECIES: hypothetical protein [unclassified Mesorhizobium]TPK42304.1 hypothetical protein FJ550_30175 [Mesorhizobium sp. B2-5-2]TPK59037.1 hypothetical protein FJ551_25830 [Mesorhizobium sp. B2-5-1]TPL44501.1 hypothetical protein FJ961_03965 [Mesorhizobium sp. B2-4-5]TPM68688.1 hypothetical protein FJ968_29770 [Mesorhizobium sp. B2-1-6]TPN71752.1 hypothetical protein FJ985_30680 [Mesorhizobium sp. B1-1-2]
MSEYPQLEAFCSLPVDTRGWQYKSDEYGRLQIRFPDPKQALGAFRIRAFEGTAIIPLRYRAMFMVEGNKGVVTSNPVSYPTFAPENGRSCQFLKAINISLDQSVADDFSITYEGTVSYFQQPVQTPVGPVGSGTWLGNQSTDLQRAWLSEIRFTISRRSAVGASAPPIGSTTPSTPPSDPLPE